MIPRKLWILSTSPHRVGGFMSTPDIGFIFAFLPGCLHLDLKCLQATLMFECILVWFGDRVVSGRRYSLSPCIYAFLNSNPLARGNQRIIGRSAAAEERFWRRSPPYQAHTGLIHNN